MKRFLLFSVSFLIIGYILLVLSMLIPNALLENSTRNSAMTLHLDGDYPTLYLDGAFLENFCDADYIAVAYNQRTNNPLYNALDAYNYCYDENSGASRGVDGLYVTFWGEPQRIYEHSHAWHGYRVFLRPLLIKYAVNDIRWILTSLCNLLVVIICILIYKSRNKLLDVLPFLFAYMFYNTQLETLSIAISINVLLMLVPCIAILFGCSNGKDDSYFAMIMYVTGACSAYFALFDLPLLSVGFPIVFRLAYDSKLTHKANAVLRMILFWALGCAIEYFPKLIIHELFMKLHNGSYAFTWYLGLENNIQIMERIKKGSDILSRAIGNSEVATELLLVYVVIMILYIILRKKYKRICVKDVLAYIFVAILPMLWIYTMVVAANIPWMIFNFSISVFAICQMFHMLFTQN